MPERRPQIAELILARAQSGRALEIFRIGPFISCYLDGIPIGQARRKRATSGPEGCEYTECIVLPRFVILLTDEEAIQINAAFAFT